ncbi:MarR family winged helix-turn-helix transcriptional regulator [Gymnodinialimonas hymeniacidonis]|uniref:MarR family winged helix-turn-helix transcriptional regulator n=1 Tax=Gymnodinialimonas hymeniacidonis TaxID=3126508 RepID=UPI0034C62325
MSRSEFHLPHFLPYLLNQAAEAASHEFQAYYRARYGMLRTEWRVLFHLGCYGELSAKRICELASLHKTKVSRAVAALESKRFLARTETEADRRIERLSLTASGRQTFKDLSAAAARFESELVEGLPPEEVRLLRSVLLKMSGLDQKHP